MDTIIRIFPHVIQSENIFVIFALLMEWKNYYLITILDFIVTVDLYVELEICEVAFDVEKLRYFMENAPLNCISFMKCFSIQLETFSRVCWYVGSK